IPAWRILESDFPRASLARTIVFVGSSALRLKDSRPTPLGPATPGVEIQAQAAEQILLDDYLYRPSWAEGLEIVYLLGLGVALIVLLPRLGALGCGLLGLGVMLAAFPLS